ncbi:MAG: hypothetical protein V1930_03845 [Pseudomonadota bacterium]
METQIIKLIEKKGPLTGMEILKSINEDSLLLWRTCKLSKNLTTRSIGYRYLRLDRRVEGFARLSPSFLREFLTYSVIGLASDLPSLNTRARELAAHIEKVSRSKSELAHSLASVLMDRLEIGLSTNDRFCFILAGDIVYNMAHDVPRPEKSTGKMINGSDVDMVVVVDDGFPKDLIERLDEEIYSEKQRLLIALHLREEIDYVVKDLARIREQVRFETFKHMVACKILQEGTFLYGSEELFHKVKRMLIERGVTDRLNALERGAKVFRKRAEDYLLSENPKK